MVNAGIWLLALMCMNEKIFVIAREEFSRAQEPVVIAPTLLVGAPGRPGRRWILSNRPVRLANRRPKGFMGGFHRSSGLRQSPSCIPVSGVEIRCHGRKSPPLAPLGDKEHSEKKPTRCTNMSSIPPPRTHPRVQPQPMQCELQIILDTEPPRKQKLYNVSSKCIVHSARHHRRPLDEDYEYCYFEPNLQDSGPALEVEFFKPIGNRKKVNESIHQVTAAVRGRSTCCLKDATAELGRLLSRLRGRALLRSLISFSCPTETTLPRTFRVPAPGARPRPATSALIPPGPRGPREISPDLFEDFTRRLPADSTHYYVFPSSKVVIPCFSMGDIKLSPNMGDSTTYKWMHSNKNAITEGRITTEGGREGSLIISDVSLSDSDSYTCTVSYIDPDSQRLVSRQFVHKLNVVALPELHLQSNIHYTTQGQCDSELLEALEMYLPREIEGILCQRGRLCSIQLHNPLCYSPYPQEDDLFSYAWSEKLRRTRWTHNQAQQERAAVAEVAALLAVQPALKAIEGALRDELCGPHCRQKMVLKVADLLKDSVLDALLTPVAVDVSGGSEQLILIPLEPSIDLKLLIACSGGLELRNGFCSPCPEQHYSEDGATECIPCPGGTYQNRIGSRSCIPCPHMFVPGCFPLNLWTIATIIVGSLFCLVAFVRCCTKRKQFFGQLEAYAKKKEESIPLMSRKAVENTADEIPVNQLDAKPNPLPKDFE